MRSIWIILKHEVTTTLSQPSFWLTTFLIPALILLMNVGTQVLTQNAVKDAQTIASGQPGPGQKNQVYSYVDEARVLQTIPEKAFPEISFLKYPDVNAAQADLQAGKMEWYFIIPKDYLNTGELTLVQRTYNPLGSTSEKAFQYLIAYNLMGTSPMADVVMDPNPNPIEINIAPTSADTVKSPLSSVVPYATLIIFFFLLTMSSGLMLRSVAKEKSNRMAEILLLSVQPRELMAGKILGLSIVALFQMLIWICGGMVLLSGGQRFLDAASGFSLPAGFLIWAVLFFLLGFLLYASLMGAIGALAPDFREAGQFTFIVILPLMIPMLLNTAFTQAPNGTLAVVLSLIPITAPTAMMTRLAAGPIPFWQLALSLGGLFITTYWIVLLAARFFRPDTLLSTSSLKWGSLMREVRRAVGMNHA
jgi:ABC-2 type transport system permease protein